MFQIRFLEKANHQLKKLEKNKTYKIQFKAVVKALAYLEQNPKHPSLKTHRYSGFSFVKKQVFEAYAQNHTSGAYRIFWYYGENNTIVIISITAHP
ncbi:MAG: hypothetical protein ACTSXL_04770 [Alphaproteobacteria bacterium]|nr:MAG: hypothetical protein B6I23_00415 [Rickettsiaceae bacterium 4572_127]